MNKTNLEITIPCLVIATMLHSTEKNACDLRFAKHFQSLFNDFHVDNSCLQDQQYIILMKRLILMYIQKSYHSTISEP